MNRRRRPWWNCTALRHIFIQRWNQIRPIPCTKQCIHSLRFATCVRFLPSTEDYDLVEANAFWMFQTKHTEAIELATNNMKAHAAITEDPTPPSPRSRFRAAMILAMAADALQIFVFPLFVEGALSPADDVLDLAVAAALVRRLGWHWEFLPAFVAELVPGVDLFLPGRLLSLTFIANGNRSRSSQKKRVSRNGQQDSS